MSKAALRWIAGAGLVTLGLLSLASGLDRMVERSPQVDRYVPEVFAAHAFRSQAARALQDGDWDGATAAAEQALARDPLDWRAPGYLVAASSGDGQVVKARRLARIAGKAGLRDALLQRFLAIEAIRAGNVDSAAVQLDILLRTQSHEVWPSDLVEALESRDIGGEALASRLSGQPQWTGRYLSGFAASPERLVRRAGWLAQAGMDALGCETVEPMVLALLSDMRRRPAQDVWMRHCPGAAPVPPIADSRFAGLADRGASGPFGWQRVPSGDVIAQSGAGGLQLSSRASVARLVVTQPVDLPPAEYRIVVEGTGTEGRIEAGIGCRNAERPDGPADSRLRATDCSDQVLGLWILPGSDPVLIRSVRVEPI